MEIIEKIVLAMRGKKTMIFSIAQNVVTYMLVKGFVDDSLAVLLSTSLTVIAGGVVNHTKRVLSKPKPE